MTKLQATAIGISTLLILALYLGCETVPYTFKTLEKSRSYAVEQTDISILLQEAKRTHPARQITSLELIERTLSESESDSTSIQLLEELSGGWFELEEYAIAGYYAQQIAERLQTGQAWGISGASYAIGVQRSTNEKVKAYCAGRAVQAFENAISLEPKDISHRINLALTYTDRPPQDNPMKGIQMLLDLDKNNPEHPSVLFHLGRLAIRTGQYDKATARLEKAATLDPDRTDIFCLLAQAYRELGQNQKAESATKRCAEPPL